MSIFPQLNSDLQTQINSINNVSTGTITGYCKTFLFDFATGDFVIKDGKLTVVSETEALNNWIEKILRTQKNKYDIYKDTGYGVNTEDLLFNNDYHITFVKSELKREITGALSKNPLIKSVEVVDMSRDKSNLIVNLKVNGSEVTVIV